MPPAAVHGGIVCAVMYGECKPRRHRLRHYKADQRRPNHDRARLLRDGPDLRRFDEKKPRIAIDKATNQPGAGDAVNFRAPARHPQTGPLHNKTLECGFGHQRQSRLDPRLVAAGQGGSLEPLFAQTSGRGLAARVTFLAREDDRQITVERLHP